MHYKMINKQYSTIIAIVLNCLTLLGCSQIPDKSAVDNKQAQPATISPLTFEQAKTEFFEAFWPIAPDHALWSGYHEYDHLLQIPNHQQRQQTLNFVEKQRQIFAQFDAQTLHPQDKIDLFIIQNKLNSLEWSITTAKTHQWRPDIYNIANGFAQIINGDFASLEERLVIINQRLTEVPLYYQTAFDNLHQPTLEHIDLAISQNRGGLQVFGESLLEKIKLSQLVDSEKHQLYRKISLATQAITQYIKQLEQLKTQLQATGQARDFRLGSDLYEQKFALEIQSEYSAKQLYAKALADKQQIQREMTKLTDQLWPKYFPDTIRPYNNLKATAQLIKHLAKRHVKRDDFVSEIRQQIPELEAFVNDKNLMTLDPNKPLVVRETPPYQRGIAGASINAPGPFEQYANTYYNVTPLDHMDDQTAESYLREYNHWILQILNIHEAIPGHYTQLVYANQSPSLVKSVFYNFAMVEGWAVYAERMMLEEGYSNFEPEMWLMYYKWNLRVITNTILDYAVHNLNMSKTQGLDLLINEAFQEPAEAEGKWRRVTLSQVQLTSYYSGYREIYDFREALKAEQGTNFDLKAFHEQFLSYGKAPVKHIKQLMRLE